MKGNQEVIVELNKVLTMQLTAINQYFLHSRMLEDWGYHKIAKVVYKESIRQMKNAQKVTDRILFLEGLPNYQKLLKLNIGENPQEVLNQDQVFASNAANEIRDAIKVTLAHKEHVSREMLEDLAVHEESHLNWLESQNGLIKTVGVENYLAEQL